MTLTERRLNSLQPYLREFYHAIPEGTYTTRELAKILKVKKSSVAPMVCALRKKGLVFSVKTDHNFKEYEHTKLTEADRVPQGVVRKIAHHKKNGSARKRVITRSEANHQLDDLIAKTKELLTDLVDARNAVLVLEDEAREGVELKAQISQMVN